MRRTITVTYTEEMVRDAVTVFVWRRLIVNRRLWVSEIAIILLFLWQLWCDGTGWLTGVFGGLVLLYPAMIIIVWAAHCRNTVGKFRKMSTRQATFAFHDEGFDVASELRSVKVPWSTVTEIWQRPTYWMIFIAINQFMTLPTQTADINDLNFVKSKVPSTMPQ
ncbi:YcxB family protein [Rhizobium sp. CNPSo 4062]|uniref:YcxB family protein n=1 Tax=Rhizobium sp. CNPSo 4062 TaxID=3021410 RepID=UPI002550B356|nr:YcxB family protein [Rhizobium sp. CNPSo 4062]MDK4702771.1 YcxB family protein [Rhizobium sp. CNPSo 4062]